MWDSGLRVLIVFFRALIALSAIVMLVFSIIYMIISCAWLSLTLYMFYITPHAYQYGGMLS